MAKIIPALKYKALTRKRLVLSGFGVATIVTLIFAHEGHKAITAKGVKMIDGKLHLEPPAYKAIGVVDITKVDFGTIEEKLRVPARVVLPPDKAAFASTRIPGVVESIRVKPGDPVLKPGEVLAEISSLELENLQLELAQKAIEKQLAEENLARAEKLGERVVAGKEIAELKAEVQDKSNEILVARRKLESLGLAAAQIDAAEKGQTVRTLPITSPIAGWIVHVDALVGAAVEPTQHLIEIHALDVVWVLGEVPESRIPQVQEGQTVRITFPAYPDGKFESTIKLLGREVSEESRTVGVWAEVENSKHALKPGLFGQMAIVVGVSDPAVVVDRRAIIEDGAEKYALVKEPNKERVYARKNVVLGRRDGDQVEVLEGLVPGDAVVTDGGHELAALYVEGTLRLSDEARKNLGLQLEEVDRKPVSEIVRLQATLRSPVGKAAIGTSRISGKVLKIHVVPGKHVDAGAVLAEVHSLEFEHLQLDYYRAALRERLSRTFLDQARSLGEIVSRKDLLRLETEHRTQLSAAMSARRRLQVLGLKEDQMNALAEKGTMVTALPIVAPIRGRVSELKVVVGQVVRPEDPIVRIVDSATLWAEATVFEGDLAKILAGDLRKEVILRMSAFGDRSWRTKLSFVGQSFVSGQKILPIFAEITTEDAGLLPGMIGEMIVIVATPEEKVKAVPNRALLTIAGKTYAFVEQGKSFRRIEVMLGRRDADYAEVLPNPSADPRQLIPGDMVAVSGVNGLNTALMSLK